MSHFSISSLKKILVFSTLFFVWVFPSFADLTIPRKTLWQEFHAEPLFDAIRDGLALDLSDPIQSDLLYLYVKTRLQTTEYRYDMTKERMHTVVEFLEDRDNNLLPFLDFPAYDILTPKGKHIHLRPLHPSERPFRGCIGADCSTDTRLTRGLEPHHVFFAIEDENGKTLGQVELVLGELQDGDSQGQRVAFLERLQIPNKIDLESLAGIIKSLDLSMQSLGYDFTMLEYVKDYDVLGGHPLGNVKMINRRVQEALEKYFTLEPLGSNFKINKDSYSHKGERFSYIAEKVSLNGIPIFHPASSSSMSDFILEESRPSALSPLPFDFDVLWRSYFDRLLNLVMQQDYEEFLLDPNHEKTILPLGETLFEREIRKSLEKDYEIPVEKFIDFDYSEVSANSPLVIVDVIIRKKIERGDPLLKESELGLIQALVTFEDQPDAILSLLRQNEPPMILEFQKILEKRLSQAVFETEIKRGFMPHFKKWLKILPLNSIKKIHKRIIKKILETKSFWKKRILVRLLSEESKHYFKDDLKTLADWIVEEFISLNNSESFPWTIHDKQKSFIEEIKGIDFQREEVVSIFKGIISASGKGSFVGEIMSDFIYSNENHLTLYDVDHLLAFLKTSPLSLLSLKEGLSELREELIPKSCSLILSH